MKRTFTAPFRAIVVAAAMALALPAFGAESVTVSATDFTQALGRARGGQTIVLAPGNYGTVVFPRREFQPALKVDARAATFTGVVLQNVSGVEIEGGTVVGPGGRSYGISIRNARDVRIANMRITGAHRGIVVNQGEGITLFGNTLTGLISDGINIAYSRGVRIENNSCSDFNPTPAVYDSSGARLRDGDHPDCIQAWSRPQFAPTSELVIVNNTADGNMQGVFLGNHIRQGVNDGGFDAVIVRGNRVRVSVPNGIFVSSARNSEVTDNVVSTIPGSRLPNRPEREVRAKLLAEGPQIRVCGNRVESLPKNPGQEPCR